MFFIIRNKNKICLHNSLYKYKIASGLNSYKYDYLIEEGKHFKAFALVAKVFWKSYINVLYPQKKSPQNKTTTNQPNKQKTSFQESAIR